jgi:uncharacterized protein YjiS (DUF1127 family)
MKPERMTFMFASLHTSSYAVGHMPMRGGSAGPLARLRNALALHRQRQHLAALDDALLKDIGLTREDALHEAGRSLWDAPRHFFR